MSWVLSFFAGIFIVFVVLFGVATMGIIYERNLVETENKFLDFVWAVAFMFYNILFIVFTTSIAHHLLFETK